MTKGQIINLQFLIGIILALIVFIPLMMGLSRCTRLSNQADDSFKEMVAYLQGSREDGQGLQDGQLKEFSVYVDKNTRIVAFPSNSDQMEYHSSVGHFDCSVDHTYKVDRPMECESGKPCICRCTNDDKPECKGGQCHTVPEVLPSECEIKVKAESGETFTMKDCTNGFALHRFDGSSSKSVGVKGVNIDLCAYPVKMPRLYSVYVEKIPAGIKFCTKLDDKGKCLTDSERAGPEAEKAIRATVVPSLERCQNGRSGNNCICGALELPEFGTDRMLSIKDEGGKTKITFESAVLKYPVVELDIPFCTFSLTDGKIGGESSIFHLPDGSISETHRVTFPGNEIKPVLLRVAGKVCLGYHNSAATYTVDEDLTLTSSLQGGKIDACQVS